MAKKNYLHFRLDGVEYTLYGDMTKERMETIVKAVEKKIDDIRAQSPHYSQVMTATLAAIQLSEELLDLKEEYAAFAGEAGVGADTLF